MLFAIRGIKIYLAPDDATTPTTELTATRKSPIKRGVPDVGKETKALMCKMVPPLLWHLHRLRQWQSKTAEAHG